MLRQYNHLVIPDSQSYKVQVCNMHSQVTDYSHMTYDCNYEL